MVTTCKTCAREFTKRSNLKIHTWTHRKRLTKMWFPWSGHEHENTTNRKK